MKHPGIGLSVFSAALGAFVLASPSFAFKADVESSSLELLPSLEQTQFYHRAPDLSADPGVTQYQELLRSELSGDWTVTSWNQFTGMPRSVQGSGVLIAEGGLEFADRVQVESLARDFVASHSALFQSQGLDLRTVKVEHGLQRWGVIFEQYWDDVRVRGSQVVLAIHDNGRLYAFGADLYPDVVLASGSGLTEDTARQIARDDVAYDATLAYPPGPDATEIVPIHQEPGQVDYHLTHRTDVPVAQPLGVYRTWVDAHTGSILYRDNQIEFAYEGSTEGDVEVFSPCDGDTPNLLPRMTVHIDGVGSVDSDDNGNFVIDGDAGTRSFSTSFDGPGFDIDCSGCGGDAEFVGTIDPNVPESIYYDAASFRPDERDAFHFTNRTKMFIESLDPEFTQNKYTVNVNLNGCCNANWSPSVMNFFEEGCGCANMAQVSAVVAHELGHGIQHWALGGGQGPEGLGEGNGDITSTFITDNPIVGIGVVDCVSGARYCENDLVYPEDLNGQIHHDGQIICGFNWDVRTGLEGTLGTEEGKFHGASLWLFARKLFMTQANNQPDQAVRYLWVDDDNGNLFDGTPNSDVICAARSRHGYGSCGSIAADVDTPDSIARLGLGEASPNPLRTSTSIRFSLAEESGVELAIFDAGGRLVRSLIHGVRESGAQVVEWDGTRNDGTAASAGVYFYRIEVGDWTETRSVALVR